MGRETGGTEGVVVGSCEVLLTCCKSAATTSFPGIKDGSNTGPPSDIFSKLDTADASSFNLSLDSCAKMFLISVAGGRLSVALREAAMADVLISSIEVVPATLLEESEEPELFGG